MFALATLKQGRGTVPALLVDGLYCPVPAAGAAAGQGAIEGTVFDYL